MKEPTLREYPREEYLSDLQKELDKNGLKKCVEKRLDNIVSEVRGLTNSYIILSGVAEDMDDIINLIEIREKRK